VSPTHQDLSNDTTFSQIKSHQTPPQTLPHVLKRKGVLLLKKSVDWTIFVILADFESFAYPQTEKSRVRVFWYFFRNKCKNFQERAFQGIYLVK